MSIFQLGFDPSYPQYLQRKIVLSNQLAVIFSLGVAAPFLGFSLMYFSALTFLPALGILACALALGLNYAHLHHFSRLILATVPAILSVSYGAYLSKAGEPFIPGLSMLALAFSILIFVIFDIREKAFLLGASAFIALLMLSMDWMNNRLEIDLNTDVIETGYLAKLSIVITLATAWGGILIVVTQTRNEENKAVQLLEQAEINKKMMLAKEADLQNNLVKLEAAQAEEKKRQWVNEGLAYTVKVIRDQKELTLLCEELISFIVKYLKANQGGIFLVNDSNQNDIFLELRAAYAYERKKFLQKRVQPGEGLLGQAYMEKHPIYLKQVPDDYVRITSGLGTANPRTVLIMPLMINEMVTGLIELASFHEFSEHEINFVMVIGENIAAAIRSRNIDEKTRELYEQTQEQAEQMRAQEEEMRQNMEELSATQEEMKRAEKEYIDKIARLESELEQLRVNN